MMNRNTNTNLNSDLNAGLNSNNVVIDIRNLHVSVGDKPILQGINLKMCEGEVHALMGPNGSGKTTLAHLLARKEGYTVTQGSIRYFEQDLLELSVEACAKAGIFLGFQYPVAIPGVNNAHFLKTIYNEMRKSNGLPEIDAMDFLKLVKEMIQRLKMPEELLYRPLNDGFSGGEKKRNEILQMSLLDPKLAILDETDSGLDIDALKAVAQGINQLRDSKRSFLLITHYQRLLNYIEPDFVHVVSKGKIIRSGDKTLVHELEKHGYDWLHTEKSQDAQAEEATTGASA